MADTGYIKTDADYQYAKARRASGKLSPDKAAAADRDIAAWEAQASPPWGGARGASGAGGSAQGPAQNTLEAQEAEVQAKLQKLEQEGKGHAKPSRVERASGLFSELGDEARTFANSFGDSTTFGASNAVGEQIAPGMGEDVEAARKRNPLADTLGSAAGFMNPWGASNLLAKVGFGAARKATAPIAKSLGPTGQAVTKLATGTTAGAATGAAERTARTGIETAGKGDAELPSFEDVLLDSGFGAAGGALGEAIGLGASKFRQNRFNKPENKDLRDLEKIGGFQTTFGSGVELPPKAKQLEAEGIGRPLVEAAPEELAAQGLAPKMVEQYRARSEALQTQLVATKKRFRAANPNATVPATPFIEELAKRKGANVSSDTRQALAGGTSEGNLLVGQGNDELNEMMGRLVRSEKNPNGPLFAQPLQGNEQAVIQGAKVRLPPEMAAGLGPGDWVVPANLSLDEVDNLVDTIDEFAKNAQPIAGKAPADYTSLAAATRKVRDQVAGGEYSKAMSDWAEQQTAFEQELGHAFGIKPRARGAATKEQELGRAVGVDEHLGKVPPWEKMTPDEQKAVMNALRNFGGPGNSVLSNDAIARTAQQGGLSDDVAMLLGLPAARAVRDRAALSKVGRGTVGQGGASLYGSVGGIGPFLGVRADPAFRWAAEGRAAPFLARSATGAADLVLPNQPQAGDPETLQAIEEAKRKAGISP